MQTVVDMGTLDFGARHYNREILTTDYPLAETYPSISPYAYCAGNPIFRIDSNGMDRYFGIGGQFFGDDELSSDIVRIMDESVWDLNKTILVLSAVRSVMRVLNFSLKQVFQIRHR